MGKVLAIANQKGGVGKTTTARNLAFGLSKRGKRVLVVDLDPQGNLTTSFGIISSSELDQEELSNMNDLEKLKLMEMSVADAMLEKISHDRLLDTEQYLISIDDVDIIPADVALSGVELTLVNTMSREYVLKEIIDPLKDQYDYILVDCSPSLGMLTVNGLVAADCVIIPVQAQFLSLKGLELLLQTIARIKRNLNKSLVIDGIVLTMYSRLTNLSKSVKETLEKNYGEHIRIYETVIPVSVKAAEAPSEGKSVLEYAPDNIVSVAYEKLIGEMFNE
ncbi:ParA family protein [Ruminiclostridium cellobioparum]|uniref:ParA family protein n=1 Tax=Ruminiclostridium cellobioparum TaxID=29355 RepID=UPI0028A9CD6E|nr:ParA family protein [Ruminiclostridium cellobioparum]